MFDCVGYVFGSGLVFPIDKKKKSKRKKKEREEERGRGQGNQKKDPATFAVFNLLSGDRHS